MSELIETLMHRDGISKTEAKQQIRDFWVDFNNGYDIEQAFMDEFGLEPDYLIEIL